MPQRDIFLHIIPKAQAKKLNMRYYYTGKKCKRGSFDLRLTQKGACRCCIKASNKKAKEKLSHDVDETILYKKCSSCLSTLSVSMFTKSKQLKSGYSSRCKACQYETTRQWKLKNKRKLKESKSRWDKANKEHRKTYVENKRSDINYKAMRSATENKRRANKIKATPKWFESDKVLDLYAQAKNLGLEVDHIVPLKSDIVCGLHCWDNLQLLDRELNLKKGNRVWPDMPAHN